METVCFYVAIGTLAYAVVIMSITKAPVKDDRKQ